MSNIIPPLISNSPPPLDLSMESDEDDFQPPTVDYLYSYEDSALPNDDLPDIDIPIDISEMDINRNQKEDKDFHDKRKSEAGNEFNNSDVILPNLQEIVPNQCKSIDNVSTIVKNIDSLDSEDTEITLITNKDSDLIPKIDEPVTVPLVDESSVNHIQIPVVFDPIIRKIYCDVNSPTETILNTELNDKAISDKEMSSSEPNYESCSESSPKEYENNEANTYKVQDKSIGDVDEIDEDFSDFANFNDVSSYTFTESTEYCKIVQSELKYCPDILQDADKTNSEKNAILGLFEGDFKNGLEGEVFEAKKSHNTEDECLNSLHFTMEADINSEEQSSRSFTISDKSVGIDLVPDDLSNINKEKRDHNFKLMSNTSIASESEDEVRENVKENENSPIPSIPIFDDDALKCSRVTVKPEPLQSTIDDSDDEFGEFDSCTVEQIPSCTHEPALPALSIDRENVDGKSKEILEMMFPLENLPEVDFLLPEIPDDHIFSEIWNLTETNALTYQWNKSNTQQSLLKVLNVDIRNVIYGPGWNPSMPIFAANLSSAPLEPQKTRVPTITTSVSNECTVDVSEVRFDWENSILSNPLDPMNQKDVSVKESTLGEPPKPFDTESVNSLQFTEVVAESADDKSVTVTDLQEFDNFTNFQAVKTVRNNAIAATTTNATTTMFPLRETYINSNEFNIEKLEVNNIVQNINSIPSNNEICQTVPSDFQTELETPRIGNDPIPDDEFTEFQASLPEITLMESKQSTNRSIEYKLAIQNPIEPEILANSKQTSKVQQLPAEVLQPTILQPIKVENMVIENSAVNIAWPEPGITDDEIRKFEEYSYSKSERRASKKLENTQTSIECTKEQLSFKTVPVVPKQASTDDEWSDFQDAAKELPLSIASLGKIAQNQALSQQKYAHTPAPKQDLWPNNYHNTGAVHNYFPPHTNFNVSQTVSSDIKKLDSNPLAKGQLKNQFDQNAPQKAAIPQNRRVNSTNDDEWSDFVCHQPSSIRPVSNHINPRQEDWTLRGPQFNSWTSTSVIASNILPSTSNSNALQFNGFNSFGRSANILNSTVKTATSVPGKNKGNAPSLSGNSKRESVPSISALPDLDFATSASRFTLGRMQQKKK